MKHEHLAQWVETLTRPPAADGSRTIAATIGGDRVEFDHLHRAMAERISQLSGYLGRIAAAEDHLKHYAFGRTTDEQVGEVARNVMRDYRASFGIQKDVQP